MLNHVNLDRDLIHIPIQSRAQFYFKITAGSLMLKSEATLLRNGQGYHWMSLAQEAALREPTDDDLREIALGYPDKLKTGKYAVKPLVFKFPYVKSKYSDRRLMCPHKLEQY